MHCFFFASRHFFKRQSASIASHINLRRDHISNQLYCELHTSLVLVMFKIVYFYFLFSLFMLLISNGDLRCVCQPSTCKYINIVILVSFAETRT